MKKHKSLSRVQLSQITGLTASAVTKISKELVADGFLIEGKRIPTPRGQPVVPLEANPRGGYSIGLAMELNRVQVVLVDFCGQIVTSSSIECDISTPDKVAQKLKSLAFDMLKDNKVPAAKVYGVGLALSGYFDRETGYLYPPEIIKQWRDTDLEKLFLETVGIPAYIDNLANAGAIGEQYAGHWGEYDNVFYLHLGYGVGAANILNGGLYRGNVNNAGEIGAFFPHGQPRPSALDLVNKLKEADIDCHSFSALDEERIINHPVTKQWAKHAASQLRKVIEPVIWLLAPDAIVIGGLIPKKIAQHITDELDVEKIIAIKPNYSKPKILAADNGLLSASLGAATLPFFKAFS
ncbi:sugar kinase [Vibrio inusitatus NBRC 102082]|uniref:Sugar kinase n=1 Tax=Vibrio inusitatus NBRC 102082 TaxID=1219070 RepID=A0A4Y3HXJ5_9VIBR|nr:sugar kinase [Vibrio inusitatus NBRC 102082]